MPTSPEQDTAQRRDRFLEAAQDYRVNVEEVTDLRGNGIRDGLITRMDEYLERADALEAAGLRG